jgi:two-component system, NarL family, nitrate/nitrite response regulator NarL
MTDPISPLTPRQRQIVLGISEGWTYARIAKSLGITERTVRMHVERVAAQLDGDGSPLRRVLRHSAKLLAA